MLWEPGSSLQGPDLGEGGGQPLQLPLCQAGAAREPGCLPRQILEQSEGAASPWQGKPAQVGSSFSGIHLGKRRGIWEPPGCGGPTQGWAERQVVALSLARRELRALGLPGWILAHKHAHGFAKREEGAGFPLARMPKLLCFPVCSDPGSKRRSCPALPFLLLARHGAGTGPCVLGTVRRPRSEGGQR